MSKGLSEVSSSKLIIAGFINHNLKLNPEDKLKIKF
jgi:Fe-S cluster assembly scaffold protein SufB